MHSTFFQLGRLHIPVFGVFVALGLITALWLSQRTARYAGADAEAVWNAGMVAVFSAFVVSRLLLVAFHLHSFLEYPLLLLALPSLTGTGVLLTALFLLLYLWWRDVPLLPLLDAATPCAALLWGFVNLGRIVEGTRDGMPTQLAWGVSDNFGSSERVHPVEVYTLIAAWLFCITLTGLLFRRERVGAMLPGGTAGIGLLCGGVAVFFLDFFRLPSGLLEQSWLDPAQIIAIAMMLTGGALMEYAVFKIRSANRKRTPHAV